MNLEEKAFRDKLDAAHSFPEEYIFKFIVKLEYTEDVQQLVEGAEVTLKASSGNKYVSVTIKAHMNTSHEVIEVYKNARKIEGLIAL